MKRTYFTLEQARQLLPDIKKQLRKIDRINRQLLLLDTFDISHDDPEQDERIQRMFEKEFHYLCYHLCNELEKLDKRGIILRDVDEGLIDFRSTYQGREIFLCWCLGEDTIRFWHEADDGFQGRKSIHMLEQDQFHQRLKKRQTKSIAGAKIKKENFL